MLELTGVPGIETAMIGNDGQFGAAWALDDGVPLNTAVMRIAGAASEIDAKRFESVAERLPQLRHEVLAYERFILAQAQQTAACNAIHKVSRRVCKWLLRTEAGR